MMPVPSTPITIPEKVRAALTADPRRSGLLAVLALVLLVLCVRAMRSGPATAAATLLQLPASSQASLPVITPNRAGSSNALVDWLAQPKKSTRRNLFAMHLDTYPQDARGPFGTAESNSSDETAKSGTPQADQNGERDSLGKQAVKLKLQSTLLGPTPMALVNGQLVREGDTIEQFEVVKIEPRRIVVQQNGVTLQISMD